MKRSHIAAVCAAAVLVMGGSAVYGLRSKKNAENMPAPKKNTSSQTDETIPVSLKPILTEGYTDDDRRYGYEVLYRQYGITITVDELKRNGSSYDLVLNIKNDSDHRMNVFSSYIAPNSYTSTAEFDVYVSPQSEIQTTVENINDLISVRAAITDIRMKIGVHDETEDGEYLYSDQIHTYFDLEGSVPNHDSSDYVVYDAMDDAGVRLWYDSNYPMTDDDQNKIGRIVRLYIENTGDTDIIFRVNDHTCYSGDTVVDMENNLRNSVPAHTGHYILMKFYAPENDPNADFDRLVFSSEILDYDNFSTITSTEDITISL